MARWLISQMVAMKQPLEKWCQLATGKTTKDNIRSLLFDVYCFPPRGEIIKPEMLQPNNVFPFSFNYIFYAHSS